VVESEYSTNAAILAISYLDQPETVSVSIEEIETEEGEMFGKCVSRQIILK
jgi:hypothetical protein